MSSAVPPSIAIQDSWLSTGLNSGILLAFLMGAYTAVYFGTLYLYMTRRSSQRLLIVVTLSLMWILAMSFMGSIWFGMNWCLGNTRREDIFECTPPIWGVFLQDLTQFPIVIIADGLLVWRCFHVWNRSILASAFPLFLALAETGFFLATIIMFSVDDLKPTPAGVSIYDRILSAAFFLSFSSTIVATLLIGYKIWSVSRWHTNSKIRFKNILEILVQSSAVYALAMLAESIEGFIPESVFRKFPAPTWAFENYLDAFVYPIACIAPTIMVARVALLDSDNVQIPTIRNLSGIQFQVTSTRSDERAGTNLDAVVVVDEVGDLANVEKKTP